MKVSEKNTNIHKLPKSLFRGLELTCFARVYPVYYVEKPRLNHPRLSDLTAIGGNLFQYLSANLSQDSGAFIIYHLLKFLLSMLPHILTPVFDSLCAPMVVHFRGKQAPNDSHSFQQ